jgi:hypothetical protein
VRFSSSFLCNIGDKEATCAPFSSSSILRSWIWQLSKQIPHVVQLSESAAGRNLLGWVKYFPRSLMPVLLNRQLNTQRRHAGLDPASSFKRKDSGFPRNDQYKGI